MPSVEQTIIALEKQALELWNIGDPSGYLDIFAPDVVYFDPFHEKKIDGHGALTTFYESIRGQIHVDYYEMLNPKVQAGKDMAVLTFNLVAYDSLQTQRWNCTEVYRLEDDGNWRIIQTHWSFTKPL